MKKYIFLLLVFTLGVYSFTVVHASPQIIKHDYHSTVIAAHIDYAIVCTDVVFTNAITTPVLMVINLPVQCATVNYRAEAPRIRWTKKGNNYNQIHPPSVITYHYNPNTNLRSWRC